MAVWLRPAHAVEAAALSELAFASKAHWPYTAAQLAMWREDLRLTAGQAGDGTVWVAETTDPAAQGSAGRHGAAGWFRLLPGSPHAVLEHFWVAPAAMGRGVGKAMLAHAAVMARAAGAAGLSIDADPYAEPFYLAQGAVQVGVVAAPLAGQPQRVRPQLLLALGPR